LSLAYSPSPTACLLRGLNQYSTRARALSGFSRVSSDTRKFYVTLIDFRGATAHFADPDLDGKPVQIYEPGEGDPIMPPEDVPPIGEDGETLPDKPGDDEVIVDGPPDITLPPTGGKMRKVYVDGVGVSIIAERVNVAEAQTMKLRDQFKAILAEALAR
jgi:type I restriction enzyme R subunit